MEEGTEAALMRAGQQIETLQRENSELLETLTAVSDALDYLHGMTPQQAVEVRKDAERYRWLRAQREWHEMNQTQDVMWTCDMPPAEVDAALDAAMAATPAVGAA